MYPGLTYIGSKKFSALYGLNEGIVDQKAIGIQHLYIKTYDKDLIHTATTAVKCDDRVYFGDRVKPKLGHPIRHASKNSEVIDHCVFFDQFDYEHFVKKDWVSTHEDFIYFKTEIKNQSEQQRCFEFNALTISQPLEQQVSSYKSSIIYDFKDCCFAVIAKDNDYSRSSLDAPSGFMYRGIEDILYDHKKTILPIDIHHPVSTSISSKVTLNKNESKAFEWVILVDTSKKALIKKIDAFHFNGLLESSITYWNEWLSQAYELTDYKKETHTMLVALKGALLDGFLPADLTGHYFANGKVCFYARDALMASRAFLYAGFTEEFESIIAFLMSCERKPNEEFYQRYNPMKKPDEGANNNVFSQIDAIGYFARVICDYYMMHHRLLVSFDTFKKIMNALSHVSLKQNLFGPEGGVNEGVFGPAYIVSTNMFIIGGLNGAIKIALSLGYFDEAKTWETWVKRGLEGIRNTLIENAYYAYGYVAYHDDLVKKYDTPQLLALSLGFPMTKEYKTNYETLKQISRFFDYGIGYSEQEYHHGPWIFNTAAMAEVAYLYEDLTYYHHTMNWMIRHRNQYGLCPEAIDATQEKKAFINPLMWANAEFICAAYAKEIKRLRLGVLI